ncbi:MAG: Uma2 family endonuclease [Rhodomicrobium sp.]
MRGESHIMPVDIMHLRDETLSFATRAAEGLPRRRFTMAEIEAMVKAGILDEDERIELIGGELVPMSPKGNHHEVLKAALTLYWARRLPDNLRFATETTFRLTPDTYLEPDFVFYDKATGIRGLKAESAHLVVEIADSSFAYDIGRKAALYASFGIKELWVIHAVRLETRIHRKPSPEGYRETIDLVPDQALAPVFAPELAVTLSELELN